MGTKNREGELGLVGRILGRSFFQRHWRHAALLIALVLTGIGLFAAPLRAALGPALPVVQAVHTYGGLLYGLGLVVLSLRLFPWPPRGARAMHRIAFGLVVLLVASGIGLLVGGTLRGISTWVHALAAAGLVIYIVVHLYEERPKKLLARLRERRRAARDGRPQPGLPRRALLRWGVGALVAIPAAYYLPGMLRLGLGAAIGGRPSGGLSEASGTLPGFVPYTITNGFPDIPVSAYRLRVEGLPSGRREFSFQELTAQPAETRRIDFTCVTGWAVDGVRFYGTDLQDFLTALGWQRDAQPWVKFSSGDGAYTDSLTAQQIARYRPLIAWRIDGLPLPRTQGAPVRLVVPGMYGYKSVKWLVGIGVGKNVVMGYWEQYGYPQNAYLGSYSGI